MENFTFRNTGVQSNDQPPSNGGTAPVFGVDVIQPQPQTPAATQPQPQLQPLGAPQPATQVQPLTMPNSTPASLGGAPGTEVPPSQPSVPPSSAPPPPPKPKVPFSERMPKWAKPIGITVLILALLVGAFLVFLNRQTQVANLNSQGVAGQYDSLELPLDDLVQDGALLLSESRKLTVNGQLQANNTLVLAPTPQPSAAVKGQIYFDQSTNQLAYFDGTEFIGLGSATVESVGGATGEVGIGDGLALVGSTITNAGVLSVQGATGAVSFTAGDGVAIEGTTITNSGVTSIDGQTGDITLGNGLTSNNGQLSNSGVLSLAAGTPNLVVSNDGAGNLTISNIGAGTGTVTSGGGTAGRIVKFTGAQNVEDSLLSESAGTVTANGDFAVTGSLSLGNALSVINGGTGATSLAANGVLVGNGTSAVSSVTAAGTGLCLMSTAGAPAFQACPGGGGGVTSLNGATGALSIANATESGGVITLNNASTSQKGIAQFNSTNFSVASGNVNTIQNINTGATPTFAGINTNSITPSGALTVGSTSQNLTLQGANTLLSETSGANTASLTFAAPTANVTYQLQTAAAGTYDVCTTAGNCTSLGGAVTTTGGTTNQLAKFSGSQTIANSIVSDNGTLVTIGGNLTVTGTTTLSTPLAVTSGGTGSTTAAGARTNLGAAASGANSDITSLSGLTTALSVVQGGTGATSLTANGVLLGNGTGAISSLAAAGAGQCLVSTAGAPTWQSCPGSGGVTSINSQTGAVTIANASAAAGTITINDASTSQKGIAQFDSTNFSVASGLVNTIQDIDTGATPTFAGINTNSITPSGPLTVGATTQDLTLQGSNTLITETNGANTVGLTFVAPTSNVTYRLQTAAAGTYDVCTTAGNCTGVGGGVSTPGGTTNALAKFTGSQTIGDSIISDDGSIVTITGDLTVTGTTTLDTPLAITSGGTGATTASGARTSLGAAASGANSDITSLSGLTTALSVVQGGTGATALTANGVLIGNGTSAISSLAAGGAGQCLVSTAGAPVWQACPGSGGVSSVNGQTGVVTIANATGSSGTVTIDDASTSQKGIAQFNSTNFSAASGTINTIQDINTTAAPTFGRLNLTSSQASNAMLLVNNTNAGATGNLLDLQLNGSSRFAVTPSGNLTLSGTVNGQSISSTASFTGTLAVAGAASLNGGATVTGTLTANTITPTSSLTVGATSQSFLLQGNAASTIEATSGSNTTSVAFQTPTADVTYRFLTATAGTYDVCTTAGNCTGVGGGVTTPGGTTNAIAKFTGSQTLGDSIISDDGSTVTIGGALAVNTITPSGSMTIGSTGQALALQGSNTSLSETDSGITNSLVFATPSGSNKTITIPNATGTVAVSATGPIQVDSNGNITCAQCVTSGGGDGGQGAVDSLNGLTGDITINNATGTGSSITIDDASTSGKGIAQFNSTNFSVSGGVVNTIQDINTTAAPTFGRLTVTSSQATNDMLVVNNTNASGTGSLLELQLNGSNRFTVDGSGNVVANGTLTSGAINGQTISSSASFTGTMAIAGLASLNGGATVSGTLTANTITSTAAMTVGSTSQNLVLQGADTTLSETDSGNTTTLAFQTSTANVTYRLLTATAGTYDICTSVGNCTGVGGGVTTSGGTTGRIAKFTGSQTLGDSLLSESGSTVTVSGNLNLTSGSQYQINGSQISSADLSNNANLAKLDGTQTFTGATNTFRNTVDSTSAVVVQNAAGRNVLNVNTTSGVVTFGNVTSTSGAGIAGAIRLADGTNDNFALTLNTTTLTADRTITLPDEAGTVCLQNSTNCGFALSSGSGNYIQNQSASDQTADFRISGTGRANTSILTPLLDVAAAGTLSLGGTATGISLLDNTTLTGNFVQSGGNFSFTGSSTSSMSVTGSLNLTASAASTWQTTSGNLTIRAAGTSTELVLDNTSSGGVIRIGDDTNNARTIEVGVGTGGSQTQTVTVGSAGGSSATTIQGGNGSSAISLTTGSGGDINLTTTGAGGDINLLTGSKVFVRSTTNSTTAFQIKNNLQTNTVFNADTSNARVGINMDNPSYTLDVFGDANVSVLSNYRVGGTIVCSVSGCTAASGSSNYIQNQNSSSQTANWRINGTGRADTALQAPLIDTASAGTLALGTTNATAINLNQNTTIASGKTLTVSGTALFKPSSNSTTAFQIQPAASTTPVLNVDTTNSRVGIGTNAPLADLHLGRDGSRMVIGGTGSGGFISFGDDSNDNAITYESNGFNFYTLQSEGFRFYTNTDTDPNGVPEFQLTDGGAAIFRNGTDSTTAFAIQNAAGNTFFKADSSNQRIGIGVAAPATALDVNGIAQQTGYVTSNTGGSDHNKWSKLATCSITVQYDACLATIEIVGGRSGDDNVTPRTTVTARVKQQDPLGSAPHVDVYIGDVTQVITRNDIVAVTTQNDGSGTVVELYGRITNIFDLWNFTPTINAGDKQWTWHQASAFLSALPAGTQTVASQGNTVAGTINASGAVTIAASATNYTERLCHNQSNGATTNMTLGDCQSTGQADLAEFYATEGGVEPGDIVAPSATGNYTVKKTDQPYQQSAVGVTSTNPIADGIIGHNVKDESRQPIALAGRVPLKVSLENGPIEVGDPLTPSSIPGVAMKATGKGMIIGTALEAYGHNSPRVSELVSKEEVDRDTAHKGHLPSYRSQPSQWQNGVGKIMLFLRPGYMDPSQHLQGASDFQDLQVQGKLSAASLNVSGKATLGSLEVTGLAVIEELQVTRVVVKSDLVVNGHIVSGGGAPTVAAHTAACGGLAASVDGTDTAGMITLVVANGSCGTPGKIVSTTFNKQFTDKPNITLTAANADAVNTRVFVDGGATTPAVFELALPSGQTLQPGTYKWYYQVIQ